MGRTRRLLPLEAVRAGPARCLPMPPRATGARGTHRPTEWMASMQVCPNWGLTSGTSGWQQGGNQPTSNQGRKPPTFNRGGKPAYTARGGKRTASGGPVDLPSEREGAGNGQMWFNWSIQEAEREEGGSQDPPYPIGPTPARWGAISQIYESMAGKDLPPSNITSEAIQAYYSGIEARMVKTWACQVLCMIAEYHMACVTRGAPVTSPILPGIIDDKLPPLAGYAPPEDRSGITDVRMRDHFAKTLRVAVWLHQLDMALSGEPAMSGSLVQAQATCWPTSWLLGLPGASDSRTWLTRSSWRIGSTMRGDGTKRPPL